MLETLREYAAERLEDHAEVEATRRGHASFYLQLAEEVAPELSGPNQAAWLQRLEQERDNLRAALDWLAEHGDMDAALRLATAATWYWLRRGYFSDAQRLIGLLGATEGQRGSVRAAALIAAARLASTQGDYAAQAHYDDESLRLYRDLNDAAGIAEAVTDLGVARWQQGALSEAQAYLEEGLRLFRTLQDMVGIATALLPLACVARDRGNFEAARPLFDEALARRQASSDQLGVAHVLNNMGWMELYAGNVDAARRPVEQSLTIRQALGARREAGTSMTLLGQIAMRAGEPATAASLFGDSLALHVEVGNRWGVALALERVAGLAAPAQPEQALRLAAAAAALRAAMGRPLSPVEEPLVADWLSPAREAVSAESAARAWTDGGQLAEASAVAIALEVTASLCAS